MAQNFLLAAIHLLCKTVCCATFLYLDAMSNQNVIKLISRETFDSSNLIAISRRNNQHFIQPRNILSEKNQAKE